MKSSFRHNVRMSEEACTRLYTVLAVGNHGHNASCTSSEASCNVPDLECGTIYTFYVSAVNSHCHSNHSDTFELESGTTTLHHMCD